MARHYVHPRPDTTQRTPTWAGHCDPSALPKGPRGFNLCRWCRTECPTRRHTFCKPECVHEWKCRTNAGYQAEQVFLRDRGQCALCPTVCATRVSRSGVLRSRDWDMDHIVPVVEGGGSCGLDNLRTLCKPCHKRVTRELAGRRAAARRAAVTNAPCPRASDPPTASR